MLPPNASPQERALAESVARLSDVPVPVRDAWNPDTCPASLLPWLAWALSVDEWQQDWTETEQRAVIKNALLIHRHKGTLAALKRAVEPLGYIIRIVEWYDEVPAGEPYTFRLEVGILEKPIDEAIYDKMISLIETYKNVRSHMLALTVKAEVSGLAYLGAAMMSGVSTTVYPYVASNLHSNAGLWFGIFEQSVDTVAVYPAA